MPKHKLKTTRYSRFEHSFEPGECFVIRREKISRVSKLISKRWIFSDLVIPVSRIESWIKGSGFAMEFYSMLRDRWSERRKSEDGKIHPCVTVESTLTFWDHWFPEGEDEEPHIELTIDMWSTYQSFRVDHKVRAEDTLSYFEMAVPSLIVSANEVDVSHKPVKTGFVKARLTKKNLLSRWYKTVERFDRDSLDQMTEVTNHFYHFPLPQRVTEDLERMIDR